MIHTVRIKNNIRRAVSLVAAVIILFGILASSLPLSFSAEGTLFQAGYTFDSDDPYADISGNYPISDTSDLKMVTGYAGYANKATAYLPRDMFSQNESLTVGFRLKLDAASLYTSTGIFYAGSYSGGSYIDVSYSKFTNRLSVSFFAGTRACSVSASMPMPSSSDASAYDTWHHIAFTFGASGDSYYLTLYIDGIAMNSSRCYDDMSSFAPTVAYFSDYSIDDVYISNRYLGDGDVAYLCASDISAFMKYIDSAWTPDTPMVPIDPFLPVDPSIPGYAENPDRYVTPVNDFSWVAYTFEDSFDLSRDLNGHYAAEFSPITSSSINTSNYSGTYGRGVARRWGNYPAYVLAFNEGLLYSENSFTVGAWVYFEGESQVSEVVQTHTEVDETTGEEVTRYTYYNKQIPALKGTGITSIYDYSGNKIDISTCFSYDEYGAVTEQTVAYAYDSDGRLLDLINGTYFNAEGRYYMSEQGIIYDLTTMLPYVGDPVWTTIPQVSYKNITTNIFDFTGKGKISFDPYVMNDEGQAVARITYGADRNATTTVTLGQAPSVKGKWIHYAMTFDRMGNISIYTNGKLTGAVSTGLKLSDLKLCNLYLLSDSSEGENGRFIVDEVYLSSKVLSAAEIRKLRYYGIARYSTEALADPEGSSQQTTPGEEEEIDLRPDETDEREDAYIDTAVINGYIGTTFDDSSFIGKDYNNSVSAIIRNASLKQGAKTYGLALNGINSYVRYPIGILDGVDALTVSIAYNWTGISTSQRSQKLFDFSRKTQSVDSPTSYISLSMGDGMSGLELAVSDGMNTTVLNSNVNVTNKWVRATVIISDGQISLYLDDTLVASSSTKVDISVINPNFNYIGKSGVKGDPLFNGAVDEIFIAPFAVDESKIVSLVNDGIEPIAEEDPGAVEDDFEDDLWNNIITGVLIATGFLVLVIIIVIIIAVIKK